MANIVRPISKEKKKHVRKTVQVFWVTNKWKEKTVEGRMK